MGFSEITIKNFRGIQDLTIKDLKQVNVLVGRNNAGKTSVLEAMFLLTGMSHPKLLENINMFRSAPIQENEDFYSFFNQHNDEDIITIQGRINKELRKLTIEPINDINGNVTNTSINGLEYKLYPNSSNNLEYYSTSLKFININSTPVVLKQLQSTSLVHYSNNKNSEYKEILSARFSNAPLRKQTIDSFIFLNENRNIKNLIHTLQKIQPNIEEISLMSRNRIGVALKNTPRIIPLNLMGDGFASVAYILSDLYAMKEGSIYLIDEIENGLHYTVLLTLWRSIISICKERNIQLIATTHSKETIDALIEVASSLEDKVEDVYFHTVVYNSTKNKHHSTPFNVSTVEQSALDIR